jgi:hypothetical protein
MHVVTTQLVKNVLEILEINVDGEVKTSFIIMDLYLVNSVLDITVMELKNLLFVMVFILLRLVYHSIQLLVPQLLPQVNHLANPLANLHHHLLPLLEEEKKKYDCNPGNASCVESANGAFGDINDCKAQCKSNPFVPLDLVGTWRGLQISKNYAVGEWRAVFTNTNVTVTKPNGEKFTGLVATVGVYITIDPQNGPMRGKKIQTMWQISYGIASKLLAWAWGAPAGPAPKGYNEAMVDPNNSEYVFSSCLPNKDKKICNFDH